MPKRYYQRILRVIGRPDYNPIKKKQLAKLLYVTDDLYGTFLEALDGLKKEKRIVMDSNGQVSLPSMTAEITGVYQGNTKGYGFVRPDVVTAEGDLYIPNGNGLDAISGDRVRAKVKPRGRRNGQARLVGQIVEVLERSENQFVGTVFKEAGHWFVQPDGRQISEWISVDDPGAKNAKVGDKVLVEVLTYPQDDYYASGVILEKLGKSGNRSTELKAIMRRFNLADKFSRSALQQTRKVIKAYDADALIEAGVREDLRDGYIITIDPEDARDFDDAISLTKGKNGQWELGVHIADVSHFVEEGTALDKDAIERGTSTYLPEHVIPMLPELLSNGICSLQEGQDRLVKSAYIRIGKDGAVLGTRFANSVIRSAKRLTYEQVDEVLDGDKSTLDKATLAMIGEMESLAKILQKRRQDQGMLTLDMPTADLIYDDKGHVVDAKPESTTFSHTMIEMFMLEANEAVARLLDGIGVPFMRRIHPEPDGLVAGDMVKTIKLCGYVLPKNIDRKGIQQLLMSVAGKPEAFVINLAVLKSLQKAEYSPVSIGHYAIASEFYCHFTSPIRRYPDLMVHRLLQAYLDGRLTKKTVDDFKSFEELEELGVKLSDKERNSEKAENELRDIKLLQMLSKRIGEDTLGVVTSVTGFGVFVQLEKFLIEGLVSDKDIYLWLDAQAEAEAEHKGKKGGRGRRGRSFRRKGAFSEVCPFKLGQEIPVRIASVNVAARLLDLSPVFEKK